MTHHDLTRIEVKRVPSERALQRYLPTAYRVLERKQGTEDTYIVIGEDIAGWTAESYVIPRLASGGMPARIVN